MTDQPVQVKCPACGRFLFATGTEGVSAHCGWKITVERQGVESRRLTATG